MSRGIVQLSQEKRVAKAVVATCSTVTARNVRAMKKGADRVAPLREQMTPVERCGYDTASTLISKSAGFSARRKLARIVL